VRKVARELGIDLTRVRGSEAGGRITMGDLRAVVQHLQQVAARPAAAGAILPRPAPVSIDFSKWGPVTKQPLTSLRRAISKKMTLSWTTTPHVTQFDDADLTTVTQLKEKYAAQYKKLGARLTPTPFVIAALVTVLKKHPMFNASLDEAAGEMVLKQYYHLGIAVDTEGGLIVPVLRDADKKSLAELSKQLQDLAERTRARKIQAEELQGGTFTISNQGGIGGAHFTPVINVPEVAILGIGKAALKPVVRQGKIEPRLLLPLGLSYDHRVIDGGNAARFIRDLVEAIEQFPEAQVKG
jgi:pyruvate dehydrogenase E2 component (dihydrolipoamide acetyltransferase)